MNKSIESRVHYLDALMGILMMFGVFYHLLSTAITLNILQAIVSKGSDWLIYYTNKGWISHLWFLWNLVFYFLFVYLIYKFNSKIIRNILNKIEEKILKFPLILILLFLPFSKIKLLKFLYNGKQIC